MDHDRLPRFSTIEVHLPPDAAHSIHHELRRIASRLMDEEREWYLGDGFLDSARPSSRQL